MHKNNDSRYHTFGVINCPPTRVGAHPRHPVPARNLREEDAASGPAEGHAGALPSRRAGQDQPGPRYHHCMYLLVQRNTCHHLIRVIIGSAVLTKALPANCLRI